LVTLDIKGCTSETILTFECARVPKLVARTSIAMFSIEERKLRRTRLTNPGIDVICLIIGTHSARAILEIKEFRMSALNAGLIIPEESLILKTVTNLGSSIELSASAANNTTLILLTIRVSFLTLVAATTIFELFFLWTNTGVRLAVKFLAIGTLKLFTLFSGRVEGGTFRALLTFATSCVEVVRCCTSDALATVEIWFLLGTDASG